MRRLALCLVIALPAGCVQLLGYSEPGESSSASGGDGGMTGPPDSGITPPKDAGLPGGNDGAIGPPGQCAASPSFQAVVHYGGILANAESVAVGDLNSDGRRDVVITSSSVSTLEIHTGGQGGALTNVTSLPFTPAGGCGPGSVSVGVGDFDGDTRLDLAYVAGTGCGRTVVRRQDPSMAGKFFAEQQVTGAQGGGDGAVTVADLDGDGRDDLVVLTMSSVQALLARSDSPGAFNSVFLDPISAFGGGKGRGAQVADLNGDGRLDIAWLSSQGVQYKLQVGPPTAPGSFGGAMGVSGSNVVGFALGDLNGDGLVDMLVMSGSTSEKFLQNPTSHLLTSGGTINTPLPPDGAALVDVNNDGRLDLTSRGEAFLQCNPGSPGSFGTDVGPVDILQGGNVFFYDLTGEGRVDAIGLDPSTNNLLVRLQN